MTKSQTKVSDSAEAKRWLIVGAHKAGASEKHVAKISGLSTTAVRNILLNYKRTGTPSIPKKISNKGLFVYINNTAVILKHFAVVLPLISATKTDSRIR